MEENFDKAISIVRMRILATSNPDETPKATQALVNLAQAKVAYGSLNSPQDIQKEIGHLLARVRSNLGPTEIMKATQAVLNLVHAAVHLDQKKTKT